MTHQVANFCRRELVAEPFAQGFGRTRLTQDAIERAKADGLEVAYGNSLRGNIAEALFSAGRWTEAPGLS